MFIAMNRFRVVKGSEEAFENVWLSRDGHLDTVPGFVESYRRILVTERVRRQRLELAI